MFNDVSSPYGLVFFFLILSSLCFADFLFSFFGNRLKDVIPEQTMSADDTVREVLTITVR